MKKLCFLMLLLGIGLQSLVAANVTITMNSIAKVMTFVNKATGAEVNVGTPTSYVYTFEAEPGTYVLTGWDSDDHLKEYGTMELQITDEAQQEFKIFSITARCANYDVDAANVRTGWVYGEDWTLEDLRVCTREGKLIPVTWSKHTDIQTSGNKSYSKYHLALNGSSFNFRFVPSATRRAEGYLDVYGSATVTFNTTSNTTIPKGGAFVATYPEDANFEVFMKPGGSNGSGSIHYVAFTRIAPNSVVTENGVTKKIYTLADGSTYNYRLWKEDARTSAGKFIYYIKTDDKVWTEGPDGTSLTFTDEDLQGDPKMLNTDPTANTNANVANILLNINERGHLRMKSGEIKNLLAQRDWQLTDNSTNNYFIEPDYHYTVLNLDGTPGNDVISIDNNVTLGIGSGTSDGEARSSAWLPQDPAKAFSPWAELKALKAGSALVLVTYDAMNVTQWARTGSGTEAKPYAFTQSNYYYGAEWSALWPENTAAFVVTVDDAAPTFDSKMLLNEAYNTGALKNAGTYVDAEHDVFYYLDTEEGYSYTFAPEGVANVEIAYPTLSATEATYSGFGSTGVTKNADGSYTILLKKGRQIVRLTGEDGTVGYQVLTAKPCTQTITNKTHDDGKFYPGDDIEVQFSGLYHPANKMAGIYNMSAYITYNNVPTGTALILGKNQYQFCGSPSAQLVKAHIPGSWNPADNFQMTDGVIQVTGYGDPIGNHRYIDNVAGRAPNFTAVAHQTYFGSLPMVNLDIATPDYKQIEFDLTPKDGNQIALVNSKGDEFTADQNGQFNVIPDTYTYTIVSDGYKYVKGSVEITGDETAVVQIQKTLEAVPEYGWDGITIKEPAVVSAEESAVEGGEFEGLEGYYKIESGYNLAWAANNVNVNKVSVTNMVLTRDISLSDMEWNTIGNSATTAYNYKGIFCGNGHKIDGLYINTDASTIYHASLFGYCNGAEFYDLTISGEITAPNTNYVGGLAGNLSGASKVERVITNVNISAKQDVGGLVGAVSAKVVIKDCAAWGNVSGTNYVGGLIGYVSGTAASQSQIENDYFSGTLTATGNYVGAIWGGGTTATGVENCYTLNEYKLKTNQGEVVTSEQMASGEIAYKLGIAWGQEIEKDALPIIGGKTVAFDELASEYYNTLDGLVINVAANVAEIVYSNTIGLADLRRVINGIQGTYGAIDLRQIASLGSITSAELLSCVQTRPNTLVILAPTSELTGANIIKDNVCQELVLKDKAEFIAPFAFQAQKATYKKTGLDGEGWYSCVLPYDFKVPENMTLLVNAEINETDKVIIFESVASGETLTVGTPFIYKMDTGGNETVDLDIETLNAQVLPAIDQTGALKGTYSLIDKGTAEGKIILNAEGSAFVTAGPEATIPAFRAYLEAPAAASNTFYSIVIDGELTGVASVSTSTENSTIIYTIDGRRVKDTSAPGLYIINGRKVRK